MKISFFVIIFTFVLSMNSYVIVRGWQALPPVSVIRPFYLVTILVLFITMIVGMIFGSSMPHTTGKIISSIGFTYMILFVYLFLSFLLVDFVRLFNHFIHFAPEGMHVFRMWAFFVSLFVTGIALIYGNYNFRHPKVTTLNLTIEKPLKNKSIKIVAVSDIHLGVMIDKQRLQQYVKQINEQKPDLILLVGDVSDRSMIPVVDQHMDEELKQLKATFGVYAINGNHEHYAETPTATADYLIKAGIHDLRDQAALIDSSLYIIGRDDRSNPDRKQIGTLMKEIDKSKAIVLLDHQPYDLQEAEQNDVDLEISGHTHNGQFFPGNLMVKRMYENPYGYLKKGKTHYYVSSGLGLWGPQYRIGTKSEIVVINLKY